MYKLIVVENMKNSILSFTTKVSFIEFRAHILTSKMALLNVNTVTLLRLVLLCLHMRLFLYAIGMMRFQ
jgi:hypothetical protein